MEGDDRVTDSTNGAQRAHRAIHHRAGEHQRWWRVNCRDTTHQPRSLTVVVDRSRVALTGPPGDTTMLTSDQVGQLSYALREASAEAFRQAGEAGG